MGNWFNTQVEWLKGFLSEGNKASSKRLATLGVVAVFCWSYGRIAWESRTLLDIPSNWSILLPVLLGIGVMSNYVNKKETGEPPKP